ncbi:drug/metabolite transporter (DMT)-like permease [Saccharothrix coeruleofusca]|uniref:DMT family transporter n=1 Tax=Saccharothrix coeruleofusca TaxID=33919 RepID=UPI001AEADD78|nr:DMT family transporter [Saccharothrix coeruleofusca]MBP2334925.1 drug/metabolite transporter (DMT)-like permease [Saccharothrix coeruleofusca]
MSGKGWSLFAVMSVLWGVPYLFIRVAVHEVDPVFVTFARVGIAALVLLPVALHRAVMSRLRGRWAAITVLALVQIVGPFTLIGIAEQHVSSSLASLLIAADPLLVAVFAIWLDRSERVTGGRMVGLLVGLVGVLLLLGFDVGGDARVLFGAALVVLAAAGYAAGALMLKRPTYASLPSLGVVTAECAIATVVIAPFAAFRVPSHVPSLEVVGSLVGLGVLCTALAWLAFFALITEVGASRGTVFTYVNPAVAVVLGVVLLDEPVTAWTAAGFLLIVLGSWLSTGGRPPTALPGGLTGRRRGERRIPPAAAADFLGVPATGPSAGTFLPPRWMAAPIRRITT